MGKTDLDRLGRIARRQRALTIAQQRAAMSSHMPSWRWKGWKQAQARWEGRLQPTDHSKAYKVRIELPRIGSPNIWVLNDPLENAEGQQAPHLYSGKRLCLFHPKHGEWHHGMFIHETLVPWCSLWLYYYEIWLATGAWLGGGEHPSLKED